MFRVVIKCDVRNIISKQGSVCCTRTFLHISIALFAGRLPPSYFLDEVVRTANLSYHSFTS